MHRVKRIVARTSLITLGLAAAQGIYIRRQFTQVEAPLGAHTGYESWMDNMKRVKRELEHQRDVCANKVMEKVAHIIEAKPSVLPSGITTDKSPSDSPDSDSVGLSLIDRIKMYFSSMRVIHGPRSDDLTPADSESSGKQRRKIKLILLGDSLVCGIGCDRELVLPNVIAKTLSLALQADVQWKAQGINGGTSLQLKSLLPHISEDLRSRSDANEEVLVVVICGLNDWKSVLLRFPFGSGPVQFKKNLDSLLSEIRELSGGACRVYLPALPIVCGDRDPKAMYAALFLATIPYHTCTT